MQYQQHFLHILLIKRIKIHLDKQTVVVTNDATSKRLSKFSNDAMLKKCKQIKFTAIVLNQDATLINYSQTKRTTVLKDAVHQKSATE